MRIGSDGKEKIVAAEWVDDEVQTSLKERNRKKWRVARREN